jgi:hypothetical protein
MNDTDVDRLDGRLQNLEVEVAELARHGASDNRVDELESRVEQLAARVRQLERDDHPSARAKARR